jgi:hypothetical protein
VVHAQGKAPRVNFVGSTIGETMQTYAQPVDYKVRTTLQGVQVDIRIVSETSALSACDHAQNLIDPKHKENKKKGFVTAYCYEARRVLEWK